ncbi:hypothetical protein RFN66_03620 [Bacillus paralicheniformis]|uniref:hypothetical protein n=1 Tax=Bacillus paralicheniformis TaxID=1648923 RepID=UPI0007414AB3|nr:hypothetical protein [Bacillus paralicheniformis]KUL16234.1 hypothetical protein LI6934_16815 [Bacillus licheniformis LMG 6934]MED0806613.1 hypothetical protein [Bacillus paralicheniformis]TWJ81722.1 hypothetical protein CHCC5019_4217 [Bacillus paralicheniformis]WMW48092.1 hypothetical protein RFN66_03620 [Bacillus paralicheniformis]
MKKEHVKTVYSNSSQKAIEHAKHAWQLGFVVDIEQTRLESSFEEYGEPDKEKTFRVHIFKSAEESAE